MRKTKKIESGVAAIYARYSSHAQRDCSIEQQMQECTAKAVELGLTVVHEYSDRAVSGKTDNRPSFQKMLKDADKGKFQYLIAWKSNRLGRNMLNAMVNEERLLEAGVKCIYVEEDFDDSAAGRFALRSMMNVNQFYSENMAEDIQRGLRDSANECKCLGAMPYGYQKGDDGRYEIYEPEAEIVREVYNRVANGEMFVSIAEDLNSRGIYKRKGKQKTKWGKSSFQNLIHNEKYKGIYKWNDIVISGGMPRIIDDELFEKVQRVTTTKKNPYSNARRRTNNGLYLLTGKVFCGKCGSRMVGISGLGKGGDQYFYYACQKKRLQHTCDKENIRRETLEAEVARAIRVHILNDEVIDWIADQAAEFSKKAVANTDLSLLYAQLSDTERSISNIMKAIEAGIITESTKNRLVQLEDDQKRIKAQITEAKSEIVILSKDDIAAGLMMFKDGDFDDQSFRMKLFDTFVKAVYVYDDNLRIVFSFSGDRNSVTLPLEHDSANKNGIKDTGQECSYKLPSGPLNSANPNPSEGQDLHFYVYLKRLEDTIIIRFVFSSLFLLPE